MDRDNRIEKRPKGRRNEKKKENPNWMPRKPLKVKEKDLQEGDESGG